MEENNSVTPPVPPTVPDHKHFFILGSLFTFLMLLFVAMLLYFGDDFKTESPSTSQKIIAISDEEGKLTDYSKDTQYVYYKGEIVLGADPQTFKIAEQQNPYEARDKSSIYIKGEKIEYVFDEKGQPNIWYSKSKDHVYFAGFETIEGADPNTIVTIGQYKFARDANNFYSRDKATPRNPENDSFMHIGGIYYKDSKGVSWYSVDGGGMMNADSNTFVVLGLNNRGCYAKDSKSVFFCGDIVEGADSATFQLSPTTNSFDAQDKNHKYLNGKIVSTTTEI